MSDAPETQPRSGAVRSVLGLLLVSYIGYYFCRVTLFVAKPSLGSELSFTKVETGAIASFYFGVYAVGKLLNGLFGDRVGGKYMILLGMVGTVVCNLAFGFGRELWVFILIWTVNAFFQSMGWLGLIHVASQWFSPRETGRAMGLLSTSYLFGDVIARTIGGILILVLSWRGMFWVHAGILALIAVMIWGFLRERPPHETSTVTDESSVPPHRLSRLLRNRWFWVACSIYLVLSTVRYTFWTWSIDHLEESSAELGVGTAAITSSVYPLLGAAGAICAGWISDRFGARRGPVIAAMTFLLVPAIYAYSHFSEVSGGDPWVMASVLGVVGFLLYGPYSLLAGAMAIDFGSRHSSAMAAGIIDAVGALGAVVAGAGMGSLVDSYGWDHAFSIVVLVALGTAVASLSLWNFEPQPGPRPGLRDASTV